MKKISVFVCIILFLISCRSYDNADKKSADIILNNAIYVYKNDDNPIKINAEKIELWTSQNQTTIINMTFEQKDEITNELLMSGKAGRAEVKDRSRVADMSDGVEINIFKDGKKSLIKAEKVKFDNRSGEISGDGNLFFDYDNSTIEGVGFKGNIKTGNYSFEKVINGSL